MSNPTFIEGSLPRRKKPAEALTGQDTLMPVSGYGIHNATPPTLADQDVAQTQMDDLGNVRVSLGDPAQLASISGGMYVPRHDKLVVDESGAPATTTITYKLAEVTVATKTQSSSGQVP